MACLEELGRRWRERDQANQARWQTILKIAVIGAGWAGLAAAMQLHRQGLTPTVFEAAPVAGGRARGVDDTHMGTIDNGQHLLVGAYTATLDLIQTLHLEQQEKDLFERLPLHLESANGRFVLRAPALPAPFHTLLAIMRARGLSPSERWGALKMMVSLKLSGWRATPLSTVAQLLAQHRQSAHICRQLWVPLCLATLNTAAHEASAQLFLNVLRDTLDAPRDHADLLVPRTDLTTLWPSRAAAQLDMRYRHIVRKVRVGQAQVQVDDEIFDACIIATPPYAVARLLQADTEPQALASLQQTLQSFSYRAIATLTLQLAQKWSLPLPLLLLDEDHARGFYGQWVFERTQADGLTQLSVVMSDAQDFLKHDRDTLVLGIAAQIREQCSLRPTGLVSSNRMPSQADMPEVLHHRLIVEKRATFAASPGLVRPAVGTAWPRLFLAGDWTDTGYPAVLEGAVRSGQQAADALLASGLEHSN